MKAAIVSKLTLCSAITDMYSQKINIWEEQEFPQMDDIDTFYFLVSNNK